MTPPAVLFRIIFCGCLLLTITQSPAQVRLAAVGGVHSANLTESNSIPGWDTAQKKFYSSKTGFQLGVLVEIPIGNKGFYFQPGLNYSSQGRKYQRAYDSSLGQTDTLYNQTTLNLNYIDIPLYITYKFRLSADKKNSFFISAGPYLAFVYTANSNYQNQAFNYSDNKYEFNTGKEDLPVGKAVGKYKTTDVGIDLKAGFEFGNVMINGYYSHGLTNAYSAGYPSTFHHNLVGASLGIWLTKATIAPKFKKDTDKDGTPDDADDCPNVAGIPKYHGCPVPDADQDGVNDEEDSCIAVKGSIRYHGCPIPDSDKDGVNDDEDSCRTIAGVAKYHGCPIPDRDGDGVNDDVDQCPDAAGTTENHGCPVLKAETVKQINFVAANIEFRVSSIRLTEESTPALAELADTLAAYPSMRLTIKGFTDNIGKPEFNLKLSKRRTEAVKNALIKLGVDAKRIQTQGFGEEQPIDDNRTSKGRAKNRRVELAVDNLPTENRK